jgi:hypothetical protein
MPNASKFRATKPRIFAAQRTAPLIEAALTASRELQT